MGQGLRLQGYEAFLFQQWLHVVKWCVHSELPETQVSRYQKGKTNLDFTGARDSEWQWHQPGQMQICTLLQTDTMPAPHHSVFTGRMPFLSPNQQRQSTEGIALKDIGVCRWAKLSHLQYSVYETGSQVGNICSRPGEKPVSYTHLTLPTIYSV